jgi:hypothetical protein
MLAARAAYQSKPLYWYSNVSVFAQSWIRWRRRKRSKPELNIDEQHIFMEER